MADSAVWFYVVYAIRLMAPFLALVIVLSSLYSLLKNRPDRRELAVLINVANDDRQPISYLEVSLGRSRSCDVVLNYPTVSRNHAVITYQKTGWHIKDTHSKIGTFVNNQKIKEARVLHNGDIVSLGSASMRFYEKFREN